VYDIIELLVWFKYRLCLRREGSLRSCVIPIVLILFTIAFCPAINAAPDWIEKVIELNKDKTWHPDAPAAVLLHDAEVVIKDNGTAQWRVRIVRKIMTTSLSEDMVFRENAHEARKIEKIKGYLFKPDGREFDLKKENIVSVGISEFPGYYSAEQQILGVFPELESGDIVAFEYIIKEREFWCSYSQGFIFYRNLPVESARFSVVLPDGWKAHILEQNCESVEESIEANRYTWQVTHLPYRPAESHMPPMSDVQTAVELACYDPASEESHHYQNWHDIALWANQVYNDWNIISDSIQACVNQITVDKSSSIDKLRAIAEFVQDRIRYVAIEIDKGRFSPRLPDMTLSNSYGDCKDKATLMRAMLAAAGISSYPVLARIQGTVEPTFPSPFQFNHVILAIPLSEIPGWDSEGHAVVDSFLYFDPTHEYIPLGYLPTELCHSYVLKISPEDSTLVRLPGFGPEERRLNRKYDVVLQPPNNIVAEVCESSYDYMAREKLAAFASTPRKEIIAQLENYYSSILQNPSISNLDIFFCVDSTRVSYTLNGSGIISSAGDYLLLKANIVHEDGSEKLYRDVRRFPVWFGAPAVRTSEIKWTLPEGWIFDTGESHLAQECKLAEFSFDSKSTGNILTTAEIKENRAGTIPIADFQSAEAYFKTINKAANFRIMIEKH